jgi:hypothetical protein
VDLSCIGILGFLFPIKTNCHCFLPLSISMLLVQQRPESSSSA